MNILYLAPQPFFTARGTPIRSRNIVAGLTAAGHAVDLLCFPMGEPLEMPGLRILRVPRIPGIRRIPVGPSPAKFPLNFLMVIRAFFLCLFNRYDAIDAVEESAFYAAGLAALFRVPLVCQMDSHMSDHLRYSGFIRSETLLRMVRRMEAGAFRRARLIVTVSDDLSRAAAAMAPGVRVLQIEDAPLNETFVEDPGRAAAVRREMDLGDRPAVVYTGNFSAYQGIDLLLAAAPHVARVRPDVCFVLVGGKPEEIAAHREQARRLGVEASVRFAGTRPVGEIPAFVTLAAALVSPRTLGTNTPMKIYDYMQSGRPVIATDLPTHTAVLDASCAKLAPPEPEAFARAVLDVLDHPGESRALAAAAAARVRERYALPVFKRRVAEAFAGLRDPAERDALKR